MMEEGISVASLSRRISTDLDLTSTLRNYNSCQYQFFLDSWMLTVLYKFINGLDTMIYHLFELAALQHSRPAIPSKGLNYP